MSQHRNNVIAATLVLVVSSTFAVGPLDEGEKERDQESKTTNPASSHGPEEWKSVVWWELYVGVDGGVRSIPHVDPAKRLAEQVK